MRHLRTAALAVLACGVTAATTPCLAQATQANLKDDIELTRSEVQSRRQEIVKELMELTPEQSEAFWPIYREYQVDAAKLGDQRVALIETYFANADKLTDEQADKLLEDAFKLRKNQLDLQKKYVGKYRKVLPRGEGRAPVPDRERAGRDHQCQSPGQHAHDRRHHAEDRRPNAAP